MNITLDNGIIRAVISSMGAEMQSLKRKDADEETLKLYPRHFRYSLEYQLQGNRIQITHKIDNLDSRTMYFGLGGHPGFILPLDPSAEFEDYYLEFHTSCQPYRVGMSDTCYVTGMDEKWTLKDKKIMPLCHEMFDEDAIILRNMSREVQLKSDKGKYSVTVSYPDMNYLGIWHWPKAEAPYVCIEPWSSLPSRQGIIEHLEKQENLIRLDAGGCYVNVWSISLH